MSIQLYFVSSMDNNIIMRQKIPRGDRALVFRIRIGHTERVRWSFNIHTERDSVAFSFIRFAHAV